MKCKLCEKNINNYDAKYHHLFIDDDHSLDICPDCTDKFTKWQGSIISDLFPTKALKKRFAK